MTALLAYFPQVEPRCEEHMDSTCWQCEGTGRLPCKRHEWKGHAEPDCPCCEARDCDVCDGKGWGRWCFHPDCEECRTVHLYALDHAHREERAREARW